MLVIHVTCMVVIFMVNKSDVEIRYINIYIIEQSSLSIRVTVPTSTGTFTQSHRHSHSRRFLDGVLSRLESESESETD